MQWRVIKLRLLLLGKAGVGKSTLLHTLLLSYTPGSPPAVKPLPGATWDTFLSNETPFEVNLSVRDPKHHVEYDIRVVDSPPLPPSILDNPAPIVTYLAAIHHAHLRHVAEHGTLPEGSRDSRFDACLLLMQHHAQAASPYLPLIKALCPYVAVLPILSKCDSLT